MRRPTRNLLWAACLVLLLGGCGGNDVPGTPTVSTTDASEPPAAQSDAPGHGAPKVDNPLDTSGPEAQPCENLTDAQVTGLLGADINETRDDRSGPGCRWHSYGSQAASVSVNFPKVTDNGLTAIYGAAKSQQYKFFKEMSPVRGYPAVAWDTTDETMTRGECHVAVGTSDRSTVEAAVSLSQKNVGTKDPCAAAHQVLDLVIGNIQGRN
ncbi:DUF3558 domain-containing protein [Amycolatopsis sp. 195334CR]|uniref:DUF3558 domain-containing protein n=1 Tax=Amycolatopsis sp. 195334CR TaxID=2814588 RepID=UPI001A8DE4A4|nr:DUF3558 domain-containing protein [Amycolatopsis sp. 195334CR]MBN6036199.1 DUF3558 domain-containing protein [Amycolatopsis sp. 195334CR]